MLSAPGAPASDLDQRRQVAVGATATKADIRLNCRTAKMAIEDCLRGLESDALVLAVQQLAQALDSARGLRFLSLLECQIYLSIALR